MTYKTSRSFGDAQLSLGWPPSSASRRWVNDDFSNWERQREWERLGRTWKKIMARQSWQCFYRAWWGRSCLSIAGDSRDAAAATKLVLGENLDVLLASGLGRMRTSTCWSTTSSDGPRRRRGCGAHRRRTVDPQREEEDDGLLLTGGSPLSVLYWNSMPVGLLIGWLAGLC
jgi:hypothetical protein